MKKTPQQIQNLKDALSFWVNVPPSQVIHDLGGWGYQGACGTIACFGGHLVAAGMFGLREYADRNRNRNRRFYPKINHLENSNVAGWLFGDSTLFEPVRADEVGHAHGIVVRRLEAAIAEGELE